MACKNGSCSRNKNKNPVVTQGANPLVPQQSLIPQVAGGQQGIPGQFPNAQQGGYPMANVSEISGPKKSFGQKVGQFFTGSNPQLIQLQNFTPDQQYALSQLLQGGLTGLQNNQFDFGPIAQEARGNFYGNTIPTLAERFTAMGGGAQNSSAFQGALGRAGAGLEQNLAALRSKYNLLGQQNALSQIQTGLAPQFQNIYQSGSGGLLSSIAPGVGQGAGLLGAAKLAGTLGLGL
jgi:hypothetical protein